MTVDPTDKLLVEAVLSRPRRAKADLEAARLANMRVIKSAEPMKNSGWPPFSKR